MEGYWDKKENDEIFSLTSKGYKILSISITVVMLSLSIVLLVYNRSVSPFAIIFAIVVFLFTVFSSILCFTHRIVINERKGILTVANLIGRDIKLKDILDINVNAKYSLDERKYCFADIILKENNKTIRVSGYSALVKKTAVNKTRNIVIELKDILVRAGYLN